MAADLRSQLHMVDVEELERQFRSDPSPQVYIPLGEVYLRRGFPFKAINVAQKGLKGDNSLEGRLLLAKAYFDASAIKRAFLKKASEAVDNIVRSDPDAWEGFRLKGEIALEQDDLQEAIQALQQAHALNPNHPQARMLLKSLNIEVQEQAPPGGPFYVDIDTDFVAPRTDNLLKTFRDISIVLVIALVIISLLASISISEKQIHGMIHLGRTQQNIDTQKSLSRATDVYGAILKDVVPSALMGSFHEKEKFYAMIHLAESHYAAYQRQDRSDAKGHLAKFRDLFNKIQKNGPKKFLSTLPEYHSLLATVQYQSAMEKIKKGDREGAKSDLVTLDSYLKKYKVELPIHVRLNWVHGLIYEAMGKNLYAKAQFKRAAEIGWDSPFYRWRLGYYHLRQREFAAAHTHFAKATEQAKQNVSMVRGVLSAPDKQKNAYCWIDPPSLLDKSKKPPPGLQLGTLDLITESFVSALRSDKLSTCPFHSAIQEKYKATPYYLLAPIGDAISVLDSGVGMSIGFKMIRELGEKKDLVKKNGNLSPHIEAWYYYALAKGAFYKSDFKAGLEAIAKAEKLAPYEAYIQSLYALMLFKTEKWDDGMARLDKAISADPLLMQPYYENAETLLNVRDDNDKPTQTERAEKVLDKMKKTFGDHSDFLYLAGKKEFDKGNKDAAKKLWKEALKETKPPYYGDHYESNLEMGKMWLALARGVPKDKKYGKDDYEELLKQFLAHKKKIYKKIDDRVVKKKDNEGIKADYEKFLTALKEGKKRIPEKYLASRVGDLREVYYEAAGAFFQASMQTRPGAVEPRLQTGTVYFENGSYTDSTGHFTIAAKGFLRDLDYKNAGRAYTMLARALALSAYGEELKKKKTWKRMSRKKQKEAGAKVQQFFQQQADVTLRAPYIKLKTTKKKKADKFEKEHLIKTIELLAKVASNVKEATIEKDFVESLEKDAELLKKQGLLAWGKAYTKRLKERQQQQQQGRRRRR